MSNQDENQRRKRVGRMSAVLGKWKLGSDRIRVREVLKELKFVLGLVER